MAYTMKQLCEHFDCERHLLEHAMRRDDIEYDHKVGAARIWTEGQLSAIEMAIQGSIARRPANTRSFRRRDPEEFHE